MAKVTNAFDTYSSANKREDLTDAIYDISPEETPLLSMIGRTTADAVKHEWQTDTLGDANTDGELEGNTFAPAASVATGRADNICMIKTRDAVVTGTQEAVAKAGTKNQLAYEMAKATKRLKKDIDTIISGKQMSVSGAAATARVSRGAVSWLTTNASRGTNGANVAGVVTDGTQRAFTETILKSVLASCFTAGADPSKLLLGAFNKAAVAGFVGRDKTTVPTDKNVVSNSVDVYIGDFHRLDIVPSRNIRARDGLVVDPEYMAVAYLREFLNKDYDQTGDAKAKQVLSEFTLEMRNEAAHGLCADLTTS